MFLEHNNSLCQSGCFQTKLCNFEKKAYGAKPVFTADTNKQDSQTDTQTDQIRK